MIMLVNGLSIYLVRLLVRMWKQNNISSSSFDSQLVRAIVVIRFPEVPQRQDRVRQQQESLEDGQRPERHLHAVLLLLDVFVHSPRDPVGPQSDVEHASEGGEDQVLQQKGEETVTEIIGVI